MAEQWYVKKPIPVRITEWRTPGDHPAVVGYPTNDLIDTCRNCGQPLALHGWVDTLEGGHIVCPGDGIVTGVRGEHYPIKPDIWAETYDACPAPAEGT